VLKHWYNLMDWEGWIPREQILGEEARSKVPREFQVQFPNYANPPTLFLVVNKIYQKAVHDAEAAAKYTPFLKEIFPALEKHFKWFQNTQSGIVPNSYRWRGRTVNHTLTSGLMWSRDL
jgi:mannosyl-oligosaccharide glucosidase